MRDRERDRAIQRDRQSSKQSYIQRDTETETGERERGRQIETDRGLQGARERERG